MQNGEETSTEDEAKAVADYYKVLNNMLSVFDLEKLYIPPQLDDHAKEMYRVFKPGARYACSEYLLSPYFDWTNEEHATLHKTYLPTLAATQSMYPADVCAALERAGFKILVSAPSKSEAWPICEQKRDLILWARRLVRGLEATESGDGQEVSIGWLVTYQYGDAPKVDFPGRSVFTIADGVIVAMRDEYDEGEMEDVGAWMLRYGEGLDGSYV